KPRRAGVTSLGIGGTNAHAILEEAPRATASGPSRPWQVLTLSAKTPAALDAMAHDLADHLEGNSAKLPDVAFTGHLGRKAFPYRRAVICKDAIGAADTIRRGDAKRVISNSARETGRPVIFLCTGQGSQYVWMTRGLYESEPEFRSAIDFCADYLQRYLGVDLRTILFPSENATGEAAELLNQTRLTQPALFTVEYALAKLWSSWGIKPASMIGHSVGELAAACIAGVFSLEAGLQIIAARGRLIQSMPGGSMTAIPLAESQVIPLLNGKLSVASVNGDEQCVISGPDHAIGDLEKSLADKGMAYHRLRVSHAFHSSMMDPILREFAEFLRTVELAPPRIPFISSATGNWITDAEAADPEYWAGQLRRTVRFANGIAEALKTPDAILLEIGPGNTLSALCEQSAGFSASSQEVISSIRSRNDSTSDEEFIARALGQLWAAGRKIDWKGFHSHERRRRLPLPTYPFERERFWIEPGRRIESVAPSAAEPEKSVHEIGFFSPSWKRADLTRQQRVQNIGPWLIFEDSQGLGARITQLLRRHGEQCISVQPGRSFARLGSDRFEIDPDSAADYQRLLSEIAAQGKSPRSVVHLWSVCDSGLGQDLLGELSAAETMSFYSLLFLGQALGAMDLEGLVQIGAVSNSLHQVENEPILRPSRALLAGPCGVIPKELTNIRCRNIDVEVPGADAAEQVVAELRADAFESPVAYRKDRRWVQTFSRLRETEKQQAIGVRDQGVYLITGGLGGIGLVMAESIANLVRARLVLVGRSSFPSRESWDEWSSGHGDGDAIARKIRKVREIENTGAEVIVATGDVCDPKAMQRIADQVRARFGGLNGIIHGAGVLDDAPLLQKDRAQAARVLAPKVRGTLVLESVFQRDPIDFFFAMSSVSSHLAPAGQVDYTAANAFLDSFAKSRSTGRTRFVSIQWPRWADVGMMAMDFNTHSDAGSVHPLLGNAKHEGEGRTVYSTTLSLENDWIVNEHRLSRSTGLFPATGYLEMVRAAVIDLTGTSAVSISDLYVSQPLKVKPRSAQPLRLLMHQEGESYRFSAQTRSRPSGQWIECASGAVAAAGPSQLAHYDIDSLRRRCGSGKLVGGPSVRNEVQERYIEFGPRWRNLKTVWLGRDEALNLLELPAKFTREVDTYQLHPALLDMVTGSAMFLIKGNEVAGHLYVPISYGSIVISSPLPATCYAHVRSQAGTSIESPIATFDVTAMDLDGNAIIEIRDFSVRQIPEVSLLESSSPVVSIELVNTQEFDRSEAYETVESPNACSSKEGAQAFERVLANVRMSSVVVFPSDFARYVESRKPRHTVVASERLVAVPSDNSNEEAEITLRRWWKELLGIDTVGSQDNFFDLGGQSLTGVRLLAKVKKKYAVDLKLATLFSAPTIEKLCALIRHQTAPTSFQSLIEIQPGGSRPPLFLIHEIEGSVLVFRDLVKHLDRDQPIWGVEYSESESSAPLLRLEDLAAHYLKEIRKLQPSGPYHLLGYSFGGLLAFEIAQQLHATGQRIELLGMLDTFLMNGVRASAQKRTLLQRVMRKAASMGRHLRRVVFGPERRAYLREDLAERLDAITGQGRQFIYGILRARGRSIPKFLHRAKDVNWYAALRYEAQPYPGRVTLFRATTPLSFIDMPTDRELGWGPLAEVGVEVHEIPGTHREIMREPNVGILARELIGCLAAAHDRQLHNSNLVPPKQMVEGVSSRRIISPDMAENVS
ncbi:MAG: SDR family NAD(P)-dependent oxidoreductase, partial [Candidatus Binatus sp.]